MPNLYDQIEEEEAKLKGEDSEPKVEEEVEIDAADEEDDPKVEESVEEEAEDEEEEEKEPEKEEEQKPDPSAYAKLRREKRELQERLAAFEAAKTPPEVEVVAEDVEPNKEDSYEEWLEWKDQQLEKKIAKIEERQTKADREKEQNDLWSGAVNEFRSFEKKFQAKTPDYEAASEHMQKRLADAILLTNPNASPQEVNTQISNHILRSAAQAAQDGYDPAESLYRQAKERFGFVKQETQKQKPKINLKQIDSNRRKSASPLQSGGQTNSNHLDIESVASMSMAEFAKLTPSQLRELEG